MSAIPQGAGTPFDQFLDGTLEPAATRHAVTAIDVLKRISDRPLSLPVKCGNCGFADGLRLGFYTEDLDEPVTEVLDRDGQPVAECPDCAAYIAVDTVRLVERWRA